MIGSCLCGMVEHAKPEQIELRAAIHAAFDQFEPIDVAL
jgi:hypothetical protein